MDQPTSVAKPSKKGFSLGAPIHVCKKEVPTKENDSSANDKPKSGLQIEKKQSASVKKLETCSESSVNRPNLSLVEA